MSQVLAPVDRQHQSAYARMVAQREKTAANGWKLRIDSSHEMQKVEGYLECRLCLLGAPAWELANKCEPVPAHQQAPLIGTNPNASCWQTVYGRIRESKTDRDMMFCELTAEFDGELYEAEVLVPKYELFHYPRGHQLIFELLMVKIMDYAQLRS